jgi:hypothetical protein
MPLDLLAQIQSNTLPASQNANPPPKINHRSKRGGPLSAIALNGGD